MSLFDNFIRLQKPNNSDFYKEQHKNECCSLPCFDKVTIDESSNTIKVFGHIKTVQDFLCVKECIEVLVKNRDAKAINIIFEDSYSITSALLGYLLKLKKID